MTDISLDILKNEADAAVEAGIPLEAAPTQAKRGRKPGVKNGEGKGAQAKHTLKIANKQAVSVDEAGLWFRVNDNVAVFYNGNAAPTIALFAAGPYTPEFLAEAAKLGAGWPTLDTAEAGEKLAKSLGLDVPTTFTVWQYAQAHAANVATA